MQSLGHYSPSVTSSYIMEKANYAFGFELTGAVVEET